MSSCNVWKLSDYQWSSLLDIYELKKLGLINLKSQTTANSILYLFYKV